jgi:hypothetical protein
MREGRWRVEEGAARRETREATMPRRIMMSMVGE